MECSIVDNEREGYDRKEVSYVEWIIHVTLLDFLLHFVVISIVRLRWLWMSFAVRRVHWVVNDGDGILGERGGGGYQSHLFALSMSFHPVNVLYSHRIHFFTHARL